MTEFATKDDVLALRNDINRLAAQIDRMSRVDEPDAQLRSDMRAALAAIRTETDLKLIAHSYPNLGATGDGDIMALAFIVMMEAAKSAREDLKAIMDGVKAINKQKEGWREVSKQINTWTATLAGKEDEKNAFDEDTGLSNKMGGEQMGAGKRTEGDRHQEQIVVNSPGDNGEIIQGGFVIEGTGKRESEPGSPVTKKDIDNAKETVKNKLDSLSEMGEMESLRLQMAMDRLSKLMSTLSNLLKKASDTAQCITQNIK
ncbi:MAG: hypothetical protein QOK11_4214 [Pseudonocardiales bacterium]|nr:hypothetical protein [Pseudonocardiales bacterium]